MKRLVTILLLPLLFYSCDWFDYHPYDGKLNGELDINRKNIAKIEAKMAGKTSLKFAFTSDTQRWYDDTERVVKHINARDDIDFVLHGGDLTDFGVTKEFLWQRDILNKLNVPYVVVIGNHDFLANGQLIFQKVFGSLDFAFMAGNVKFVCLNTNALEMDYSHPVPDFKFIRGELDNDNKNHEKTVFLMHSRPFSEQFNNNVADLFQDELLKFPSLQFCLNGHDHNLHIDDLFDDGIIYYGVPAISKRQYFTFTINEEDYEYELVEF